MKISNHFFIVFLSLSCFSTFAQDFSKTWNQYFSYLDISVLTQSENKIYAAAENAIFTYDKQTFEVTTISSVQGLSGDNISALIYIEGSNLLMVGFENGLIQILNENTKDVLNVVDIIDKQTILPDKKKINNFLLFNNTIYISADFGISEYSINQLEFGDTFFIGDNGSQLAINEIAVFEGYFYAATGSGIRRALTSNPNLIDFQQWQTFAPGNWTEINQVGTKLYAAATDYRVYNVMGVTVNSLELFPTPILDLSAFNNQLAVTTSQISKITDENYVFINSYAASDYNNTNFSNTLISNLNSIYLGTKGQVSIGKEGYGMLKAIVTDNQTFEEIHPSSPLLNRIFQIDLSAGQIWAVHGSFAANYGFNGGIQKTGVSRFKNSEWQNIPYDTLNQAVPDPFYINHVLINKFNSNKAYISSYWTPGYLELQNSDLINLYTEDNSSLDKFVDVFYLLMTANYDANNALWVTNGRVDKALNKFADGVWQGIDLSQIIANPTVNLGFSEVDFDADGNVFMGTSNFGVISYNVSNGELNNIIGDENNMPSNDVRAIRVDRSNQVWVGTNEGLRIIFDPSSFANGNPQVESIIFLEDGIASELFFFQYINDIEVDGTNNKWIGTLDNGAFYISSDGQSTIFNFTKDNSPLPSNDILDIKINETTGEVFFATDKGMVSFKGTSSAPQDNLENAYVFPNPVRPGFNMEQDKIKITGLSSNVNVKITDIEGNLVTEAESRSNGKFKSFNLEIDGGTALWNGRNLANKVVASGVYVILLNDLETFETKVLKVMLIRQ
jgi:glutaredoxin-related protein